MAYELTAAQKATVLDQNGTPLVFAAVTCDGYNTTLITPQADASGNLEVIARAPGQTNLTIHDVATGLFATHLLTITPGPFDWTLDTPVPR